MRYYVERTNPYLNSFDNLFSDLFDGWTNTGRKIPSVDVWETDGEYVIEAEVAGYDEDAVRVHVDGHVLTISSDKAWFEKKRAERKECQRNYVVREIYTPEFQRSFVLPEGVDEGNIAAEYKKGVLCLHLPKLPKTEPKRIEIKIN